MMMRRRTPMRRSRTPMRKSRTSMRRTEFHRSLGGVEPPSKSSHPSFRSAAMFILKIIIKNKKNNLITKIPKIFSCFE
jgi:hypothetical protein